MMQNPTRLFVTLGMSAALGFLSACSSGGTSPSTAMQLTGTVHQSALRVLIPNPPNSNAQPDRGTDIYVCGNDKCLWYPRGSNFPAGTISGLHPSGIGIDRNGNVYVGDLKANEVLVYAKHSNTLLKTLLDPGQIPIGIAIDSDGTVYVANNATTGNHMGSVSVYAHGSTNPTSNITDPNFGSVAAIALDKNHMLYVCYGAGPDGKCDKFAHAKGHGINVITIHGIPTGVATDAQGNVVVNNGLGSASVYSGANMTLCNTLPEAGFPTGVAFDKSQSDIFIVHNFNLNITEERYPGCAGVASLEYTYSWGWSSTDPPFSVAVNPSSSN